MSLADKQWYIKKQKSLKNEFLHQVLLEEQQRRFMESNVEPREISEVSLTFFEALKSDLQTLNINVHIPCPRQENLGSNELLLYVAVEPEAVEEAGRPPVPTLRKKHSVGSAPVQGTMAPAPRIAYSYQVNKALN